jgi:hypothetical protein
LVSEHLVGKSTSFLSVSALSYFFHPSEVILALYFQLVRTDNQVGTAPAILRRKSNTYLDLSKEEPTMRAKMAELAKQAGKALGDSASEGGGRNMTRTVMIVGLIAALVLTLGGAALAIAPAWAELNVSESAVLALKQEVATNRAQIQKLSTGTGAEAKRIDLPVTPDCASRPEALMVIEAALGLCK